MARDIHRKLSIAGIVEMSSRSTAYHAFVGMYGLWPGKAAAMPQELLNLKAQLPELEELVTRTYRTANQKNTAVEPWAWSRDMDDCPPDSLWSGKGNIHRRSIPACQVHLATVQKHYGRLVGALQDGLYLG
jgi:hypothetical protein